MFTLNKFCQFSHLTKCDLQEKSTLCLLSGSRLEGALSQKLCRSAAGSLVELIDDNHVCSSGFTQKADYNARRGKMELVSQNQTPRLMEICCNLQNVSPLKIKIIFLRCNRSAILAWVHKLAYDVHYTPFV